MIVATGPVLAVVSFKLPFVCGETYRGTTYQGHPYGAIDFNKDDGSDVGDPVLASVGGEVVDIIENNGQVHISHADGWETVYAHMAPILVNEGDTVQLGEQIGNVSDVGEAEGAHLHYQQLEDGSERLAKFDGVTYVYNTLITSTNCGGTGAGSDGRFVAGDFNADGDHDVAAFYDASAEEGDGAARLHVWRAVTDHFNYSGPDGWWSVASGYPLERVASRFVAGDFDADGDDDVATMYDATVTPGVSAARIHVWLSTRSAFTYQGSSGWWSVSSGYPLDRVANRMVAGDFDEDGDDDIAVLYDAGNGAARIHVWLSTRTAFTYQGSSGWWSVSSGYPTSAVSNRFLAGDFDEDGDDDVATLYDAGSGAARIHVWRSNHTAFVYAGPSGWWSVTSGYDLARVGERFVAADLDEDGDVDVATLYDATVTPGVSAARIHVWKSNHTAFVYQGSSGWWSVSSGYPLSRVGGRFVAGDIDLDGDGDTVAFYDAGNGAARLHAWLSTHTALTYQGSDGWWSVSSGYPLARLG